MTLTSTTREKSSATTLSFPDTCWISDPLVEVREERLLFQSKNELSIKSVYIAVFRRDLVTCLDLVQGPMRKFVDEWNFEEAENAHFADFTDLL